MDHSLYAYLSRQESSVLEKLLAEYLKKEPSIVQRDVVVMARDILEKRAKEGNLSAVR